ncbi:hypothetical protein GCM10023187_44660 [Nibrella viscosa]|uniref:Uncharacterized protein n=1 Tax=Nibrella viscosa TaxID=1084524 RepID=A0ABP8KSV8_9BACT
MCQIHNKAAFEVADKRLTFDPETRIDGQNDLPVPVTKIVTFGLNIGL